MVLPTLHWKQEEDVQGSLDGLKLVYLMASGNYEALKLATFFLVVKGEAKSWYNALGSQQMKIWDNLKKEFQHSFGLWETPNVLWDQFVQLH